ncbi:MAG: hypothetical protein JSR77_16695 [Planctomycetes bacterium]|nr:hypothetical protein [Planctomycetota bacterium]
MGIIRNPGFDVDSAGFRAAAVAMRNCPGVLPHPLVVICGYHSPAAPGWIALATLRRFAGTGEHGTIVVSYPSCTSKEAAADRILRALDRAGMIGRSIDVMGISMGGIMARWLAARGELPGIQRLVTLASPHRGAKIARSVRPDAAARDLRPGSDFIGALDADFAGRRYELFCYATLRDWLVGARNTAPVGMSPVWVDPTRPLAKVMSHFTIGSDWRIMADVATRLLGRPKLGTPSDPPRD